MKDSILAALPENFLWRNQILWYDCVDSTNTRAKELAKQGATHGTVLIADRQTGGRGRLGRSFHSPAGTGIYLSLILRPECLPGELMHLTCAAAVAMCDAVEQAVGLRPAIKWTNDLVSGKRKLGGILTELGLSTDGSVDFTIIGIGINCCQKQEDFPEDIRSVAASLASVSRKEIDRSRVAAAMIHALYQMDRTLLSGKDKMLAQYCRDCVTIGQNISLIRDTEVRHGRAVGLDENGALLVEFSNGYVETVSSGEVSIRGMYGYV